MRKACQTETEGKERGSIPSYVWLYAGAALIAHAVSFYGTRLLLPYLPVCKLSLPMDAKIPFIPEWVSVYCLSYISWIATGIVVLAQERKLAFRFAGAYVIGMLLSGVIFLIWPLTIDRPEIIGEGMLRDLLRMIYRADQPNNLFPSLHVLVSYLCWRGLLGCPGIPKWYKIFNLICLVLVCMSVVFVKQHLSIDIPGGIAAGEISIQAMRLAEKKYPRPWMNMA